MLPKKRRLTTEFFDEVIVSGKVFHSPVMSLKAIKVNEDHKSLFAVVASKKSFKTAVIRNKMRRKTYAALASLLPEFDAGTNAFRCILIMKLTALDLKQTELTEAARNIFVKSRILT